MIAYCRSHFQPDIGSTKMYRKIRYPKPRLGSIKRVRLIGGGLVAIFSGSPGNYGPIVGNLRRPPSGPYPRLRMAYIRAIFSPISWWLKWPRYDAFLAEIMVRKSGIVNSKWPDINSQKLLGEPRPIHQQSGATLFRMPHFYPILVAPIMTPKIGYPYPRLWYRKRAPIIRSDWHVIYGRS